MAVEVIKQESYTDDLTGEKLPANQRVQVRLSDGQHVWYLDTRRDSTAPLTPQIIKDKGAKQAKRGAKPKASA